MVVIPYSQIEKMNEIMDELLKHPGASANGDYTVGYYKTKYNLTNEEYNMIYDLCMPLIRRHNAIMYWRNKYYSLKHFIKELAFFKFKDIPDVKEYVIDYFTKDVNQVSTAKEESISA